jgi:hypothetical protein
MRLKLSQLQHDRAQRVEGATATGTQFPAAAPKNDRIVESYYVCGIVKSMRTGWSLYAMIPLTGKEAVALRELDAKRKAPHDAIAVSKERRGITDAHNMETKTILARTGKYELNSFVPAKKAEALIAKTAKMRFNTML